MSLNFSRSVSNCRGRIHLGVWGNRARPRKLRSVISIPAAARARTRLVVRVASLVCLFCARLYVYSFTKKFCCNLLCRTKVLRGFALSVFICFEASVVPARVRQQLALVGHHEGLGGERPTHGLQGQHGMVRCVVWRCSQLGRVVAWTAARAGRRPVRPRGSPASKGGWVS